MLEQSRDILYGANGVDAEHILGAESAPHTNLQNTNNCDIVIQLKRLKSLVTKISLTLTVCQNGKSVCVGNLKI